MLELCSLDIDNVFSYGKAHVEFKPGLVLLEGRNLDEGAGVSNMSGKTALLESITTALFEKNSRGELKDSLLNVVGKFDMGKIVVGFKVFGDEYEVVYQRGTENRWFLRKGTTEVIEKLWTQMPALIGHVVGMTYDEFMLSSFLEQGRVNRLMEMGDTERKEVFGNWLGLSDLALAREIVKKERKKVEDVLVDLTVRVKQIEEWKKGLVMTREEAEAELRSFEDYLMNFTEAPCSEQEYIKLRSNVLDMCKRYRKAKVLFDYYQLLTKKVEDLRVQHRELTERLKLISGNRCWVCGSSIDGQKLKEGIQQQLVKIDSELSSYESVIKELKERVRILDTFDRKSSLISAWSMRNRIGDVEAWKHAIARRAELRSLLALYDKFDSRSEELDSRIVEYARKKEIVDFWYDGFGPQGIGTLVMERLLKGFNGVLSQYSQWLGWDVRVELKKDKLFVLAKDRWKELKKLEWYSGSERGLISFVLCLGISQWLTLRGIGSNVLILDEVFAPFDAEMRSRLVELLKELSLNKCVIVVTHHDDVKNMVNWDSVWVVEKKNGVSNLVK